MSNLDCYYFGCQIEKGHYLYLGNYKVYQANLPDDFPVNPGVLDGGFLPPKLKQLEGRAELIHCRDWTILTFWDRSLDKRLNSNSSFVARGILDFTQVVEIAKKYYSLIWERFNFEVVIR